MICEVTPVHRLLSAAMPRWHSIQRGNSWDWICEHGRMPDGTPFDGEMVPWSRGVCEAWDHPFVREMTLMWGTRLGKTSIGIQLMQKVAATAPAPGLFATSTQSLAERTVRNKIYPSLKACRKTAPLLPHERWWTVHEIRLSSSPWAVAWSGSDTQLADWSALYGFANEIDKWTTIERRGGTAGEGDSEAQFLERFKEFLNAKILFECSPSVKGTSRIERRLLQSNNCRYWVGCPACGGRQVLSLNAASPESGGLLWDKYESGESDPELARRTARYVCCHCRYEIHDDQRKAMMQSGVWVPAGCGVTKTGRVTGTPKADCKRWGGQLSSLYSLQLRWGDVAEEFVRTKIDPRKFRMFVNGWLAETWELLKSKTEPEEVGARLATDVPSGVIPAWATWLFAGVDIQAEHFVYVVLACGPDEKIAAVEAGELEAWDDVRSKVIARSFEHQSGHSLTPAATAIDSGHKTKECYSFCQAMQKEGYIVRPVKGANTDCAGEPFETKVIGKDERKSARANKILVRMGRGLIRLRINPFYYEPIIQEQLDHRNPGDPGSLSLSADLAHDNNFLRQMCNAGESHEPSKMDPDRRLWVKRWDSEPNDIRDAYKYARAMMDYAFKRDWGKAAKPQPQRGQPQQTAASGVSPPSRSGRFRPQRSIRRARRWST